MTATIPPTLTNNERLVLVKTTDVEDYVNQLADRLEEDHKEYNCFFFWFLNLLLLQNKRRFI